MSADGSGVVDVVLAQTAVFTRTVSGRAILGDASKNAVTFDHECRVTGVSVSWPEYSETGDKQTGLSADAVFDRARRAVMSANVMVLPRIHI